MVFNLRGATLYWFESDFLHQISLTKHIILDSMVWQVRWQMKDENLIEKNWASFTTSNPFLAVTCQSDSLTS